MHFFNINSYQNQEATPALFAITVLHLIPDAYSGVDGHDIGIYILIGFMIQVFLEQFSHGVEHGHMHHNHDGARVFPYGIMISLCLHAFLEGMPLAKEHHNELILVLHSIIFRQHLHWPVSFYKTTIKQEICCFTLAYLR